MNALEHTKGRHLHDQPERAHEAGGLFSTSILSKVAAARLHRLLDQMDAGLLTGSVQGSLPDGSRRMLGGRTPGAEAEMNICDWRGLARIAWSGSIGLYQGWAKGEWDSPDPAKIFELFVANRVSLGNTARPSPAMRVAGRLLHMMRRNSKAGARRNIEFHYDLGNDFYAAWLDETMTYSSALFADVGTGSSAEPLAEAQRRKNAKLLERLNLKDGDRLLEIGCGWGGLAEAALRGNGLKYHGITLSNEQKAYADKRLAAFGENASITITDYRDVAKLNGPGQFDAIASVEMVEAVGQQYWPAYVDCIQQNLKPGGRAAIQYIRIEDDIFDAYASNVDFIQRYIFPGGMLLSESRFRALAEESGLIWQDQHDFGLHYAETLLRWRASFEAAAQEGRLPQGFDETFVKLWRFYLMYCEGGFRGGGINVAQVTLVKP